MIDPICGMTVEPESAAGKFDYKGQTYYFCSVHCQKLHQRSQATYRILKDKALGRAL